MVIRVVLPAMVIRVALAAMVTRVALPVDRNAEVSGRRFVVAGAWVEECFSTACGWTV